MYLPMQHNQLVRIVINVCTLHLRYTVDARPIIPAREEDDALSLSPRGGTRIILRVGVIVYFRIQTVCWLTPTKEAASFQSPNSISVSRTDTVVCYAALCGHNRPTSCVQSWLNSTASGIQYGGTCVCVLLTPPSRWGFRGGRLLRYGDDQRALHSPDRLYVLPNPLEDFYLYMGHSYRIYAVPVWSYGHTINGRGGAS